MTNSPACRITSSEYRVWPMEIAIMGGSWEVNITHPKVIGLCLPSGSLAIAMATGSGYFALAACS